MKVAILTCILGDFDTPVDPVKQTWTVKFHRFTDADFPPITGLTPRLQYRIPKCFGWQMFPGYDIYIWLDGTFSFGLEDSVDWLMEQLGDNDMAVFKHPWRDTIKEESDHIEDHLRKGKPYITSRYKNGLHKEQLRFIQADPRYVDDKLFTSTVFVYRNTAKVQMALTDWWLMGSRYFTCDQLALPYVLRRNEIKVSVIPDNQYKTPYLTMVSKHK
jgi:hypothetical protein